MHVFVGHVFVRAQQQYFVASSAESQPSEKRKQKINFRFHGGVSLIFPVVVLLGDGLSIPVNRFFSRATHVYLLVFS